jgi:hypothetical protein
MINLNLSFFKFSLENQAALGEKPVVPSRSSKPQVNSVHFQLKFLFLSFR